MGRRYDFRAGADGTGSTLIPIAAGDFFVNDIDPSYERGQCCLAFYGPDGTTLATPLTGTIIFRASCIEGQFLRDSSSITVDATQVQAGDAAYTPPVFNGPAIRAKMTLAAITGVSFVAAHYWASEG